jgi:hypothetical protein
MKHCLLYLAVAAALVVGAPAYAQFVFLDTNGDGLASCTDPMLPDDVLAPGTMNVDVYFDTNHNPDGSLATCDTGPEPLSMNSYTFVLRASGTGSVVYNSWDDLMGYTTNGTGGTVGSPPGDPGLLVGAPNDAWVALASTSYSPPGKYKVGTLNITVTGNEVLTILADDPGLSGSANTSFGTECFALDFDNTYKLGLDFPVSNACGTEPQTPVKNTTWGKIKDLYN